MAKRVTYEGPFETCREPSSPIPTSTKNRNSSFINLKDKSNSTITPNDQTKLLASSPDYQNKTKQTEKDPDFTFEKECYVCQKSFSLFINRHHCRWCGHSICKEHSQKSRPRRVDNKIEQMRICDNCDNAFVQNNMNQNLAGDNEGLRKKINKLKLKLQQSQKETIDLNFKIKELENIISGKESEGINKEQKIRKLLQEEQMKHEHTRNVTESLRIALEQSQKGEKITEDLNKRYKAELEQQKISNEILNQEIKKLKNEYDKVLTENQFFKKQINEKEEFIENISTNRASSFDTEKGEEIQSQQQASGNFNHIKNLKTSSLQDSVLQLQNNANGKRSKVQGLRQEVCCIVM